MLRLFKNQCSIQPSQIRNGKNEIACLQSHLAYCKSWKLNEKRKPLCQLLMFICCYYISVELNFSVILLKIVTKIAKWIIEHVDQRVRKKKLKSNVCNLRNVRNPLFFQ